MRSNNMRTLSMRTVTRHILRQHIIIKNVNILANFLIKSKSLEILIQWANEAWFMQRNLRRKSHAWAPLTSGFGGSLTKLDLFLFTTILIIPEWNPVTLNFTHHSKLLIILHLSLVTFSHPQLSTSLHHFQHQSIAYLSVRPSLEKRSLC